MKTVIMGCGKFGTAIISRLVSEGHDVTVVDNNQSAINEITDLYDIMCVTGNGVDNDVLREAGVSDCQMFVACSQSDESNMLACFIAKRMGAEHVIARIRNPEYNDEGLDFLTQQLGLSLSISPESMSAKELCDILKFPSAVNIERFSGRFELIELVLKEGSPIIGVSLAELRKKYSAKFLICAALRDGNMFIPTGNFVPAAGDKIAITAAPGETHKLLKQLEILQKAAKNVMIMGAGRIAFYLSKLLTASGIHVTVIEIDPDRAKSFSDEIADANVHVLCGDGSRPETLDEEGLSAMDAFVALTGSDEQNILTSIYASSVGIPKVISKVNRPELASMAEKLGLDCIVSPCKFVSNTVGRYARAIQNSEGSNFEALYRIMDDQAEAIEFNVGPDFKYADIPLKDLKLRNNILISGIIRKRKATIPNGNEVISAGDRVIVLSTGHIINKLSDIIQTDEEELQ